MPKFIYTTKPADFMWRHIVAEQDPDDPNPCPYNIEPTRVAAYDSSVGTNPTVVLVNGRGDSFTTTLGMLKGIISAIEDTPLGGGYQVP